MSTWHYLVLMFVGMILMALLAAAVIQAVVMIWP